LYNRDNIKKLRTDCWNDGRVCSECTDELYSLFVLDGKTMDGDYKAHFSELKSAFARKVILKAAGLNEDGTLNNSDIVGGISIVTSDLLDDSKQEAVVVTSVSSPMKKQRINTIANNFDTSPSHRNLQTAHNTVISPPRKKNHLIDSSSIAELEETIKHCSPFKPPTGPLIMLGGTTITSSSNNNRSY
jgi:hypothetical protein